MKTLTTVNLLFLLLISCGPKKNPQASEKEIKGIPFEIAAKSQDVKSTKVDSLIFIDLDSAIANPEKVIHLTIYPIYDKPFTSKYADLQHLPAQIGKLVNLKILEIHCLKNLDDLPFEIGQLINLEKIDIDNGNGCQMNISIPPSIGQLQKLKELILYGAIDPRDISNHASINPSKLKKLPSEIGNLKNLEVLNLGRNGIQEVPMQIQFLSNLRILKIDYNNIIEIPSFFSKLKKLEELDLTGNQNIKLPDALSELKNLKIYMKNNSLKIVDQKKLIERFPNLLFDFENEYIGGNEEPTVKN